MPMIVNLPLIFIVSLQNHYNIQYFCSLVKLFLQFLKDKNIYFLKVENTAQLEAKSVFAVLKRQYLFLQFENNGYFNKERGRSARNFREGE